MRGRSSVPGGRMYCLLGVTPTAVHSPGVKGTSKEWGWGAGEVGRTQSLKALLLCKELELRPGEGAERVLSRGMT